MPTVAETPEKLAKGTCRRDDGILFVDTGHLYVYEFPLRFTQFSETTTKLQYHIYLEFHLEKLNTQRTNGNIRHPNGGSRGGEEGKTIREPPQWW